jgi:hypothetical protein
MLRSLRSVAFGLVLLVPALVPAAAGSAVACAAEGADAHAALVVSTGGQTFTYCVALDAQTVSGLRLIQLASAQHGLKYRLGFGGQAVCQLAGIGPTGGDCFADYPDFWGYWHGNGGGGWAWAGSGAASASIGDGDVEGWSWGSGDSGATHPAPPALSIDDVCDAATEPPPGDDGGGGGGGGGGGPGGGGGSGGGSGGESGGGGSGGAGSGGGGSTNDPSDGDGTAQGSGAGGSDQGDGSGNGTGGGGEAQERADAETSSPAAAPTTPAADVATLASDSSPGGGDPPLGALVALALIGGLGVAGWVTLRRRDARGR